VAREEKTVAVVKEGSTYVRTCKSNKYGYFVKMNKYIYDQKGGLSDIHI
jgi:hypothetical protein